MSTYIYWEVPTSISDISYVYWDKARIYRSPNEQSMEYYELKGTIDSYISSVWTTNWIDTTDGNSDSQWYLARYYSTSAAVESTVFATCYFALTPREQRLITVMKHQMDPRLYTGMADYDFQSALNTGLNLFNLQPPLTSYSWDNLLPEYESLVSMASMIAAVLQRYLNVSMRDFSYSDQGLSLTIDLQGKMKGAIDEVFRLYEPMVKLMKLEEAYTGMGLGSWGIPMGMGGRLSGALMNILDLYRSFSY